MHRLLLLPVAWALLGVGPVIVARAETVVLAGGGRIQGEVLEQRGTAETLMLRTPSGATIGIPREQVERLLPASEMEQQYRALHAQTPDTLEDHLRLAQWCKEHELPEYRSVHLRAVLRHDPDHAEARRLLGYTRRGGRWLTEQQWMASRGYVRYGRRWKLPQEVAILTHKADQDDVTGQWHRNIKQLYEWATGRDAQRRAEGLQTLRLIDDPAALGPMEKLLGTKTDVDTRLEYVRYLARVGNEPAIDRLVMHSINDLSTEVRSAALVALLADFPKQAARRYTHALGYFDHGVVRTAAAYLDAMQDPATVGQLIEAVVTVHPVVPPPNHNVLPSGLLWRYLTANIPPRDRGTVHPAVLMMSAIPLEEILKDEPRMPRGWLRRLRESERDVFALSPRDVFDAGTGTGPKPQTLPQVVAKASGQPTQMYVNKQARAALVTLTSQDFGFDEAAWLEWFGRAVDRQYRPLLEKP